MNNKENVEYALKPTHKADKNAALYLDLLEKVLTDLHRFEFGEVLSIDNLPSSGYKYKMGLALDGILKLINQSYSVVKKYNFSFEKRLNGKDWPQYAETMIGLKRLKNIRYCAEQILYNNIEGDFIETGVWRGGATIFMRAILRVYGCIDKNVWVADSFEGLPIPNNEQYPIDTGDIHHKFKALAISLEQVKHNFEKYGMLDGQVRFLKGWFKDTLPSAPIKKLSLLRLDGDMYESTINVLENLYPKLSIGGYIIIDDFALKGCKAAVMDYRRQQHINEKIEIVDWTGVYWRKLS